MAAGGFFGSTNTDTEDLAENVSYALSFQALLAAVDLLEDNAIRAFAYEQCLTPRPASNSPATTTALRQRVCC